MGELLVLVVVVLCAKEDRLSYSTYWRGGVIVRWWSLWLTALAKVHCERLPSAKTNEYYNILIMIMLRS